MARAPDPRIEQAYQMFIEGHKLVEIASQLNLPGGTVRRWKSTHGWDNERSDNKVNVRKESERTDKNKKEAIAEEVKQVMENPDLTDKQRLFCLYYVKSFNATTSYQKAYDSSYAVANVEGCKLLVKPSVKEEIYKLKQSRLNQSFLEPEDIFERYMNIAFSDITDYLEFGNEDIKIPTKAGDTKEITVSYVNIKDSSQVDGSLIREVSQGKEGIKVKLLDQMKALDWLAEHMNIATEEQKEKLRMLETQRKAIERQNDESDSTGGVVIVDDIPRTSGKS